MTRLDELPDLARIPEVAAVLAISPAQAWRMVWSGELPSVRLSERIVRVRRSELAAWLESKSTTAGVA